MARYTKYEGSPEERDAKAIEDIRSWLGQESWDTLMQLVGNPETTIPQLNFALSFAGVSGYPFHAFCRKYCLQPYREWMAAGEDSIQTDERGHGIYDKEEVE